MFAPPSRRTIERAPGWSVAMVRRRMERDYPDGRAEIIPFRYLPVLLGGKGTSHVEWDTIDLPSGVICIQWYLGGEKARKGLGKDERERKTEREREG